MDADRAPPFEVTSPLEACLHCRGEGVFLAQHPLERLFTARRHQQNVLASVVLPTEASPLSKTTAWEPLPQATDEARLHAGGWR